MNTSVIVANDIIDLEISLPLRKTLDQKFLQRIFSMDEQEQILSAPNSEIALWLFWAGKEVAYKLVSQMQEQLPIFSPIQFQITKKSTHLVADYCGQQYVLHYQIESEYLHVYASHPQGSSITSRVKSITKEDEVLWHQNELHKRLNTNEKAIVKHIAQALVRIDLKQYVAETLRCQFKELEVIRLIEKGKTCPPYLVFLGNKSKIAINFSHHGKFYAWVCS